MTSDNPLDRFRGQTRRSFVKKGALTSAVLGTVSGTAVAEGELLQDGRRALMFAGAFRPGGIFRVESQALNQAPFFANEPFRDYDPYIIEYRNTNEHVTMYVPSDVQIQEGDVYALSDRFELFQEGNLPAGVMRVSFEPVNEEQFDGDFNFDIGNEDFDVLDGGGKALVRWGNFFPGSFFRVVSGVVQPEPREDVRGSDIFSEYNTRHARFLGMNQNFVFYPAHEAEVEWGNVYQMTDEFDITDPEGRLTTIDFERVDEQSLEDDFRI